MQSGFELLVWGQILLKLWSLCDKHSLSEVAQWKHLDINVYCLPIKLFSWNHVNCFMFTILIHKYWFVFLGFPKIPSHSKGKWQKRQILLLLVLNALQNNTPLNGLNQARRGPPSPASSSCLRSWVDVMFWSVTEALMQHLKTLFFTSSWTSVAQKPWNCKSECGFWDWITCEAELWPKQP